MVTVLSIFFDEVILLFKRCEPEVNLLVRMLDLIVTVIQLVIFNFESHELLLDSKVVIQLFFQLGNLNLLPGDDRPLV